MTWLLILYSSFVFASKKVEIESGIRTESNVFYKDRNKDLDMAFYFAPSIQMDAASERTSVFAAGNVNYSKYLNNDMLDNVEYSVFSGIERKLGSSWKIGIDGQ